jgi:hypothetical protein
VLTSGSYKVESMAHDEVVGFFKCQELMNRFSLYHEVEGEILQPRTGTEDKKVRIDFVIVPKQKAIQEGWSMGAVGIELKKSGTKIGRQVCQAMDYTRAAFQMTGGILINLSWVFIGPSDTVMGDLGSVMAQNRIGVCCFKSGRFALKTGSANILNFSEGVVKLLNIRTGGKVGSR